MPSYEESAVFPARVTRGEGGVYRWKYTLEREQAMTHYKTMNIVAAAVATAVCLVAFAMFASGAGGSSMTFRDFLLFPLVLYGGVLGLPALIGYLTLGWDTRSYEMDEEEIRHKHATRGGDAQIMFRKAAWMGARGNALILKQGITTYTVYVPAEDADFVKAFVKERIGNAQAVR